MRRLSKHAHPGMLIAFEGIDGCGKGTQIDMLCDAIAREGWADRIVRSKQPGGTQLGNSVRDLLFHSVTTHRMNPDACSLLYLVSHLQNLQDVVLPALRAGKIVVSDRWDAYSGTVFGRHGLDRPVSTTIEAARMALGGPEPDLMFFLHGNPKTLLERATGRTNETHEDGKVWANVPALERLQTAYFNIFEPLAGDPDSGYRPVTADPVGRGATWIFNTHVWPTTYKAIRRHFDC